MNYDEEKAPVPESSTWISKFVRSSLSNFFFFSNPLITEILKEHQVVGIIFLIQLMENPLFHRGLLVDEMGLEKTNMYQFL
jgi:SNF2 family DNA or RNA helicase